MSGRSPLRVDRERVSARAIPLAAGDDVLVDVDEPIDSGFQIGCFTDARRDTPGFSGTVAADLRPVPLDRVWPLQEPDSEIQRTHPIEIAVRHERTSAALVGEYDTAPYRQRFQCRPRAREHEIET